MGSRDYSSPRAAVVSNYEELEDNLLSSYSVSDDEDVASSNVARVEVRAEPIAIVRSEFTGPNNGNYHYAYETANGIKQDVTGEMKVVDDAQVYVMRGSYSYTGADGLPYVVDWFAAEEDAAAAAASANNVVYAAPEGVVGGESVVN